MILKYRKVKLTKSMSFLHLFFYKEKDKKNEKKERCSYLASDFPALREV